MSLVFLQNRVAILARIIASSGQRHVDSYGGYLFATKPGINALFVPTNLSSIQDKLFSKVYGEGVLVHKTFRFFRMFLSDSDSSLKSIGLLVFSCNNLSSL